MAGDLWGGGLMLAGKFKGLTFGPGIAVVVTDKARYSVEVEGPAPAPVVAVPAKVLAVPSWVDDFKGEDPSRWLLFNPSNWPPKGVPGRLARTYFYGWPDNSGGQDPAARTLKSNGELQCYEDRGCVLGPDGLSLVATRDPFNHHSLPWTSGCVAQSRDAAQLYGYFEITTRVPVGRGIWPAFWLLDAAMEQPPTEIDVLECVAMDANNVPSVDVVRQGVVGGSGDWPRVPNLGVGFHRFGVLWTPDAITFTVDGVQTSTQATPARFNKPCYMLANLAIGGSWPGNPPDDLQRAEMVVRRMASYKLGSWGASKFPVTA